MKNLLLIPLILLLMSACSTKNDKVSKDSTEEVAEQTVYICTGPMSTKYHLTPDCEGLSHCSGEIEEVSLSQAEEGGNA